MHSWAPCMLHIMPSAHLKQSQRGLAALQAARRAVPAEQCSVSKGTQLLFDDFPQLQRLR